MLSINRFQLFSVVLGFALVLSAGNAQTAPAATNLIHVDAPTAQRLILAELNKHPEIVKIGLHAVPPSATDNAIIACSIASKIGKKSSPSDMENLAAGKPVSKRIDKEKIFDLMLPITDAHGGDLNGGFVVMEVPFDKATNEQEALKIGIAIRDELQSAIPNKAALYQR
jgi:hypothetical protein